MTLAKSLTKIPLSRHDPPTLHTGEYMLRLISLLSAVLFSVIALAAPTAFEKHLKTWERSSGPTTTRLNKLYQAHWDYLMTTYPEWATYTGYPGQDHRLTDYSTDSIETRKREARSLLKSLETVSEKSLKGEDLITFQIFKRDVQIQVEGQKFPSDLIPMHQMNGIQVDFAGMLMMAPRRNLKDYENRLARMKEAVKVIEQTQLLLAEGLKKKITPPKIVLIEVPKQIALVANPDLAKNPLYESFASIEAPVSDAEKKQLQDSAKKIISESLVPAFKKLHTFYVSEYLPHCRQEIGMSSLPDGVSWYNYRIKDHTTTDMTADEIHNLGLKEVARIRSEMEKVREKSGFNGDFARFNQFLKDDAQFHPKSAKALLDGYREIAKRIDPELPRFFGQMPRLTYGVREMPAYKAPAAPTAYYMQGSLESGRAGYFEANTYDLKARPVWQMEALTLHEAVPGHHFQIALAQELKDLPEFRKNSGPTAFVEGWALYAESLGEDLGLYKDIYSKYGQLTFEMWRAIRLVVDTGIHAKGWSRDQVIKYFRNNGPFTEQQIINETDRYIADGGQALAYKIGELKFKELKERARLALGDKFDIRKFHDQVLSSGAIPLPVVDQKINNWIHSSRLQ